MAVIGASMLGALAAGAATRLFHRVTQPHASFSDTLARAIESARSSPADKARQAEIDQLTQQLLSLPITSDEARALATDIVTATEKARSEGGPNVSRSIEKAVSRVVSAAKKQYHLSGRDSVALTQTARQYMAGPTQ